MKTHPRAKFHLISPTGYRETRVHGRTHRRTNALTHNNDNLNIPAVATQTCRDKDLVLVSLQSLIGRIWY
jgi:hypothetical protein